MEKEKKCTEGKGTHFTVVSVLVSGRSIVTLNQCNI